MRKPSAWMEDIEAIRNADLKSNTSLWHHRNYFLFMFNMRGMNFIDLAFLPTDAIQEGRLRYKPLKHTASGLGC